MYIYSLNMIDLWVAMKQAGGNGTNKNQTAPFCMTDNSGSLSGSFVGSHVGSHSLRALLLRALYRMHVHAPNRRTARHA